MVVVRIASVCVLTCLALPAAAEQATPPKLNKAQRNALHAVVSAVDRAAAAAETSDAQWQTHTLRASDGSHYVAFSTDSPAAPLPRAPVVLYVRLASRAALSATTAERSAVMEWLQGLRSDPLPLRPAQAMSVPSGELPVGGTTTMSTRQSGAGESSAALAWVSRQAERDRDRKAARERQRKAELDGSQPALRNPLFPFEDFDVAATAIAESSGAPILRRSLTAGPGDYDLYVGWMDAADRSATVRVLKKTLSLPAAPSAGIALSSIILADSVGVRDTPYPAGEQTAHPYAIGATDITPARDEIFNSAERLALVVQVINPQATGTGKPDVTVAFRLFRTTPAGEESVGILNPQHYNAGTLPSDFDLAKGHPVFAAVAAPLGKLPRGAYRLRITVSDRVAGGDATRDAEFRIVGTPATLLASAPPVGAPFQRASVLDPSVLDSVVAGLRPATPSRALTPLLDAVATRRFVDALREESVSADEGGLRAAVRGIALYALGDAPATAAVQLQRALQLAAPEGPVQVFLGACRALLGNDRDAALAWTSAFEAGIAREQIRGFLVDALLRQGEGDRALAVSDQPSSSGWARPRVAALLLANRDRDAARALDERLADHPDDVDAQWLLLHALFAHFVREPAQAGEDRERFTRVARAYIAANGPHASLATEWLEVVETKR